MPAACALHCAAQGGCGCLTALYSCTDDKLSPLRNLLRPGTKQRTRLLWRAYAGYDAYGGADLPFPESGASAAGLARPDARSPQIRLSCHAERPMALADGQTEAGLAAACEASAGTPRPVPSIEPVIDLISGLIAVILAQPSPGNPQLAADATCEFDLFRAPLTSEDRARRNPDRLTPRQCEYLDRWGYPYAMEEFRST